MKQILCALLLSVCVLASACSPLIYSPTPHQTPLLEATGETRASILVGVGLEGGDGIDLAVQAAHAPLPHVFVHGSAQQSLRSEQLQSYGEVGVGAWLPLSRALTVEVLGATGEGAFALRIRRPISRSVQMWRYAVRWSAPTAR